MRHLTRLTVRGYRRLASFDVELRPVCVAIGANGCGKSSLLEIVQISASAANRNLASAIYALGGLESLQTRGSSDGVCIGVQLADPQFGVLGYQINLKPFGVKFAVDYEILWKKHDEATPQPVFTARKGTLGRIEDLEADLDEMKLDSTESVLGQLTGAAPEPAILRQFLSSVAQYDAIDVAARSPIRIPQQIRPATTPGNNGEDLASCLFYMRETDRDRFDVVEDTLRAAFHDFERLDFPPVAAGTLAMTWKDSNFSRPFYMHELGDGMLRFLWLVALLQSPGLTAVTLIDEPEIGLHPELLALLVDLFREASARTQLIVATHSDRLVRFLEPKEVLAFDVAEDGTTTAKWADEHDLDRWLADYTLDEVWRMGRIGGRS